MLFMSVTEETSQPERSPLKEEASQNMPFMSVTEETSQPERSPLKALAVANMPSMLVTEETSQPVRLPSKEAELLNMLLVLLTFDRSGASVAWYTMVEAELNALCMVVHSVSPHCSMDLSWREFGL